MAEIFISYARLDRDKIAPLSAALEQAVWAVWWDRHIDGTAIPDAVRDHVDA